MSRFVPMAVGQWNLAWVGCELLCVSSLYPLSFIPTSMVLFPIFPFLYPCVPKVPLKRLSGWGQRSSS